MSCGNIAIFFFNDTATTEISTLSLHDALPIYFHPEGLDAETLQPRGDDLPADPGRVRPDRLLAVEHPLARVDRDLDLDRKSTRLNSSHANISYAVFCLKKKNPPPSTLSFRHLP